MGLELAECWRCDVCGHLWIRGKVEGPKQCSNPKCRTWKWNKGKGTQCKSVLKTHPPAVQIGTSSAGDSRVIVSDETKKHPPVRAGEDEEW